MKLSDFFKSVETNAETHSWTLVNQDSHKSPIEALASALADRIMEHRCIACPCHYKAWKQHVEGGPPPGGSSKDALIAFIKPAFGLPTDPEPVLPDHLEGFVAEQLWYFLSLEVPLEEIVRIERPGFLATDPGGDGLVIHRVRAGHLMFRLWEIKKCTGDSPVSATVNTAYNQLNSKATEYLARYTAIGQELPNAELAEFYGQLIDFWVEARPEAAAGVSVTTSTEHAPQQCFTTFGQQFPRFVNPVRLRGMLTAIENFPAFAVKVRDMIWIGL